MYLKPRRPEHQVMKNASRVERISECFLRPDSYGLEKTYHLGAWDLAMLSVHYIQKGLLFTKSPPYPSISTYLETLKNSLSLTLFHFYPLAGRLATRKEQNPPSYTVFIDCNNSPGAKFIHAQANHLTVQQILSSTYTLPVVHSFFDHDRAVNHDGHTMPLLTIQVTELFDGIFIGCSMNHVLADGTSFWHFFNAWSEIFNAKGFTARISRPPIHERWFPKGHGGGPINLPYSHHSEFVGGYEAPELRERFFHFSARSIANLKARANSECGTEDISSFQALSALVWRSITRARGLLPDVKTCCRLAVNNRTRMVPPLSLDYFGNSIQPLIGTVTAGELVGQGFGQTARVLHEVIANHDSEAVEGYVESLAGSPIVYQLEVTFGGNCVMMGSSPRFDMYGNEFGMGKAVAVRSGYGNKFDGKVSSYPGNEGGGSVDLEVCLPPHSMTALESQREFMDYVTLQN